MSLKNISFETMIKCLKEAECSNKIVLDLFYKIINISENMSSREVLLSRNDFLREIMNFFVQKAIDDQTIITSLQTLRHLTFINSCMLKYLPNEVCVLDKVVSLLELSLIEHNNTCPKLKPHLAKELLTFLNNYFYEKSGGFEYHQLGNKMLRQLARFVVIEAELVISVIYNFCGNQPVIAIENDFALFNIMIHIFNWNPILDTDTKDFCWFIVNVRSEQTRIPQSDLIKAFHYIIASKFFIDEIKHFNIGQLKFLYMSTHNDFIRDFVFNNYTKNLINLCNNSLIYYLDEILNIFGNLISKKGNSLILMNEYKFHAVLLDLLKTYHLDSNHCKSITSIFLILTKFLFENRELLNYQMYYNYKAISVQNFFEQYVFKNVISNKYQWQTNIQIIRFADMWLCTTNNRALVVQYFVENFDFVEKCSESHIFVNSRCVTLNRNDYSKVIPSLFMSKLIVSLFEAKKYAFLRDMVLFNEDIIMNIVESVEMHKASLRAILNLINVASGDGNRFLTYLLKEHQFYSQIIKVEQSFLRNNHFDIDVYSLILYIIRRYFLNR